jgi:CubicO group peptidase (beta-lactamase class C family)
MNDQVQGWTNKDVLALLQKENRLLFPPGSKASYSNSGYVVLALAVERISGRTFEDVLRKEIFRPSGMKQTNVVTCPGLLPRGAARGYRRAEDGAWKEHGYDLCTTGSGGIVSTAADLVRWVEALESGRIISAASLQEASRPATLTDGRPTAYGFGWLAEFATKGPLANVWYTASFGDLNGYRGMLKRIPDRKLTMIVLTNRGAFPWKILETIHQIYA